MKIQRVDDYQSWSIQTAQTHFLVDPWLTGKCILPGGTRIFSRTHHVPPLYRPGTLPAVDGILLSAHFGDHFHEETLSLFPKTTPIFSTQWGARRAEKIGFKNVSSLAAGELIQLGSDLRLTTVAPAFPYAHNSLGFLFQEENGSTVLLETHGVNGDQPPAQAFALDALITAIEDVRFLGVRFTLGESRLLEVITKLRPKVLIPTGTQPQLSTGLLPKYLLSTTGSIDRFATLLSGRGASTQLLPLQSGEFHHTRGTLPLSPLP